MRDLKEKERKLRKFIRKKENVSMSFSKMT